ncbi:MAG: hypothetical protein ACFCD0_15625 [Gemmataceae bacterium]
MRWTERPEMIWKTGINILDRGKWDRSQQSLFMVDAHRILAKGYR